MAEKDSDIHEPKLPGVRTLTDDTSASDDDAEDLGVKFIVRGGKQSDMHEPEEPVVTKANKDSILSNEDDVFDVGHAFHAEGLDTGTIVTDRKKRPTSFSGVMKEAFNEWWGKTSSSLQGITEKLETLKPEEPPTVEAPEKRKEVILEAAQLTKQAPRDDHQVVVEKLKTMTHDAESITGKPYFIKKPEPKRPEASGWKYTVDDGKKSEPVPTLDLREISIAPNIESRIISKEGALAPSPTSGSGAQASNEQVFPFTPPKRPEQPIKSEGPRTAPEVVGYKDLRHSIPGTVPEIRKSAAQIPRIVPFPKPPQKESPIPPLRVERQPDIQATVKRESKIPREVAPIPSRKPTEEAAPIRQEPPAPRAPRPVVSPLSDSELIGNEPKQQLNIAPPAQQRPRHPSRLPKLPHLQFKPNTSLNRTTVLAVVIAGVLLGVGGGIYTAVHMIGGSGKAGTGSGELALSGFSVTPEPLIVGENDTREMLVSRLTEKVRGAPRGMSQFYPAREVSRASAPLTTEAIMPLLAPHASNSFVRQLDPTIMIGGITTSINEPYLILRADTFDNGFAGMLAWEPYLSEDLNPLMGDTVTGTLVPGDSGTVAGAPRFVDALKDNRSIRILYDEAGKERIIYAFVNRTTIIITTSTAALSALVGNLN